MDVFRQGGMDFETWFQTFNLENAPVEERERFEQALAALEKNVALRFIINRLEAKAYKAISRSSQEKDVLTAHQYLLAIQRLKVDIVAAVQDRNRTTLKLKK